MTHTVRPLGRVNSNFTFLQTGDYTGVLMCLATPAGDQWEWEIKRSDLVRYAYRELLVAIGEFTDQMPRFKGSKDNKFIELNNKVRQWGEAFSSAFFATSGSEIDNMVVDPKREEFLDLIDAMPGELIAATTRLPADQLLLDFLAFNRGNDRFFLGERLPTVYRFNGHYLLREKFDAGRIASVEIGYAEDHRLDTACKRHKLKTRPTVEELYVVEDAAGGPAQVDVLEELQIGDPQARAKKDRWWGVPARGRHFKGHTVTAGTANRDVLGVRVRNGETFDPREFEKPGYKALAGVFVFFNTCRSAIGTVDFFTSLAAFTRRQGASAVICTLGPVEDHFAREFARAFYDFFSQQSTSALDALIEARRVTMRSTEHPMALLYTVIGDGSYRLWNR